MVIKSRSVETKIRLESITIEGYRSCRETNFTPNAHLSTLIGINGVGKTNLLQAIRLLDPRRGHRRVWRGAEEISEIGSVKLTAWFIANESRVGLRLVLGSLDGGRRNDELVSVQELWNLGSFTGSKAWKPMPPASFLRDNQQGAEVEGQFFLFNDDVDGIRHSGKYFGRFDLSVLSNKKAVEALIAIADFRSGISYYSASQFTDPSRCPSSFEVDEKGRLNEPYLSSSGAAHLRFLHDLYALCRDNELLYEEYCRFVSKKQLGLISRFTWKEIELSSSTAEVKSSGTVRKIKKRKTLVIPKVQVGMSHITFNQLSEGTFKTLALAFYIITDSSKFLMIEEPEVCVHHGLLQRIVETIKAYAHRKQTIISTHSDLLVDELDPKHIFVVEMTPGGTSVKALEAWLGKRGRDALHGYLAESGPLGEYWRSGGFS